MQSNVKENAGADRFCTGVPQSCVTNNNGPAFRKHFWVVNGLVQGNKKKPNPIAYGYTVWYSHLWRFTRLLSGNPVETQTRNSTCVSPWSFTNRDPLLPSDRVESLAICRDSCLGKVFEQMRYGKGNLVVDLAESAATMKMLRNAVSVRKLVQQAARSNSKRKSGKRLAKDATAYTANKWLEYRYGWMPFILSTYELLETLAKRIDRSQVVVIKGTSGRTVNRELNVERYTGLGRPGNARTLVKQRVQMLLKVRMRGKTSKEIYDYTSLNPLGIAWELMPLSFIGDWFVNVGQCLSLWEDYAIFANNFIDGFETAVTVEDATYEWNVFWSRSPPLWPDGSQQPGFYFQESETHNGSRRFVHKERTILTQLPSPGGVRVQVKLNAKRFADAAALIRGLFR